MTEQERWDRYYRRSRCTDAETMELDGWPTDVTSVLDIGCGTGALVRSWAARGVAATGLDVSREALVQAARLTAPAVAPYCRWVQADWYRADEVAAHITGTFDLVVSMMGPDFSTGDALERLLTYCKRYGRLLLFVGGDNEVAVAVARELSLPQEAVRTTLEMTAKQLRQRGMIPTVRHVDESVVLSRSVPQWVSYLERIFPSAEPSALTASVQRLADTQPTLHGRTTVTYAWVEWEMP